MITPYQDFDTVSAMTGPSCLGWVHEEPIRQENWVIDWAQTWPAGPWRTGRKRGNLYKHKNVQKCRRKKGAAGGERDGLYRLDITQERGDKHYSCDWYMIIERRQIATYNEISRNHTIFREKIAFFSFMDNLNQRHCHHLLKLLDTNMSQLGNGPRSPSSQGSTLAKSYLNSLCCCYSEPLQFLYFISSSF